jgi:hypothetical protein
LDKDVNPSLKYGVHPKPLLPNRVDLYVPAGKKELLLKIQQALARDGSSLSAFVMELLEKWWDDHKPGNPQTSLERYDVKAISRPGFQDVGLGEMWYSQKQKCWFRKTSLWMAPAGFSWTDVR